MYMNNNKLFHSTTKAPLTLHPLTKASLLRPTKHNDETRWIPRSTSTLVQCGLWRVANQVCLVNKRSIWLLPDANC